MLLSAVHDFRDSLRKSAEQADNPIWESVYRKAFPTFDAMSCVRKDGWAQRGGIDRVVVLSSGRTLTVDEKVRDRDYGDILLEYWSNEQRKVPGWVAKDLACDYIAYAILPTKKCYLLPFQTLRKAWQENRKAWVQNYRRIEAQNSGYVTVSVGVPVPVLMGSLTKAMEVAWS